MILPKKFVNLVASLARFNGTKSSADREGNQKKAVDLVRASLSQFDGIPDLIETQ